MGNRHPLSTLSAELADDGWLSPDTYSRNYAEAAVESAVYLFLAIDIENPERFHIAYVGMSTRLAARWATHETLRAIEHQGWYVRRLFKRTDRKSLREVERCYIEKFDPPWNIIGRKRGVPLHG